MSRIGKQPIKVISGVKLEIASEKSIYGGQLIRISGKNGNLNVDLRPEVNLTLEGDVATIVPTAETEGAYHGLYRTLVNNAILGVDKPFVKELEIVGIGYKADVQGQILKLTIGYTHPISFELPAGIKAEIRDKVFVKISGIDKQLVGEIAAKIRQLKKPEPYKGKGIKYIDEVIKKKAGKAAA